MDEDNPEIELHPMAGRTFRDNPVHNEFLVFIKSLWQPLYYPENCKQAIRFIEVQYPKSQIGHHFNEGGCNITEHCSDTSG